MTITFDNKMRSRGLSHMNLIVAQVGDEQVIFEFSGKSIPGAVTVVKEDYEKNGKWSHFTWVVELANHVYAFVWPQDWDLGLYVTAGTWDAAQKQVRDISKRYSLTGTFELSDAAIERFIRAQLGKAATKLDAAEIDRQRDPTPILAELLAAQVKLAEAQQVAAVVENERLRMASEVQAAINAHAAAEKAFQDAATTLKRIEAAKAAMAKGASLADLQALLGVD